jgi:hypothetical protein
MTRSLMCEILPQLNAAGITSYLEANTSAETVAACLELARRHELTARVSIALSSEGKPTDEGPMRPACSGVRRKSGRWQWARRRT